MRLTKIKEATTEASSGNKIPNENESNLAGYEVFQAVPAPRHFIPNGSLKFMKENTLNEANEYNGHSSQNSDPENELDLLMHEKQQLEMLANEKQQLEMLAKEKQQLEMLANEKQQLEMLAKEKQQLEMLVKEKKILEMPTREKQLVLEREMSTRKKEQLDRSTLEKQPQPLREKQALNVLTQEQQLLDILNKNQEMSSMEKKRMEVLTGGEKQLPEMLNQLTGLRKEVMPSNLWENVQSELIKTSSKGGMGEKMSQYLYFYCTVFNIVSYFLEKCNFLPIAT